jgi:hypothetical protein
MIWNRESRDPGIGERFERFLTVVFRALGSRAERGEAERRSDRGANDHYHDLP